jgi:hypothetical protein
VGTIYELTALEQEAMKVLVGEVRRRLLTGPGAARLQHRIE